MEKIPLSKDKFMRGLIAGFIAGLIKDIPSVTAHLFQWDVFPTYWDYSGMIAFGKVPHTATDIMIAIIVEVVFSMAIGAILVHVISKIKSHHYLIAGAFSGAGVWFFIRATMWILDVKKFNQPQMLAFIINAATSIGYGLLIAYLDKLLQKAGNRSSNGF